MVPSKEDYRFVTYDAMRHIVVRGTPFPLRGGRLTINGEDEAFLREASIERRYFTEDPYASAYTAAIWRVKRDIDAIIYNSYKGISGRFADPQKLRRRTLEVTVYDFSWCTDDGDPVEGDPGSYLTVAEADRNADRQIDGLYDTLQEETDKINERRQQDKLSKDADLIADTAEAVRIRNESLAAQEETHARAVLEIEDGHEEAVEMIRAAGLPEAETKFLLSIEEDEYATALFRENAADSRRREDIWNAYYADWNEAYYLHDTGFREIDADADLKIRELKEACDGTADGIRSSNRTFCFDLLCRSRDPSEDQLLNHSPDLSDYSSGVAGLIITKTCAGEFYRRRFSFRNAAAGAIYRVFADLERMRIVRAGPIEIRRKSHTVSISTGGTIEYHENSGDMSPGSGGLLFEANSSFGTYTPSSKAFSIFSGTRENEDAIECIIADVEIIRDEHWSVDKGEAIADAIIQMRQGVSDILEDYFSPLEPPVGFDNIYHLLPDGRRFYRDNTYDGQPWVEDTDNVVNSYNRRFDQPDGDLRDERGNHYGRYIARTVFTRDGVQAEDWLRRMDGIDDTRAERLKEAEEARMAGYKDADATYFSLLDAADRELAERYGEIERAFREGCVHARAQAYARAIGEIPGVNERIANEIDISAAIVIRDGFMDGEVSEAQAEYSRLERIAENKRRADRTASEEDRDSKVDGYSRDRYDRRSEIDEEYSRSVSEIDGWYHDEVASFRSDYEAYVAENPDGERWRPERRVRFSAEISERGEDGKTSDIWGRHVYVSGIRNAFVVYAPRTETGVDFSKYYEEIEDAD